MFTEYCITAYGKPAQEKDYMTNSTAMTFVVYREIKPLVTNGIPHPIIRMSPFSFLGASGIFFHFYFILR